MRSGWSALYFEEAHIATPDNEDMEERVNENAVFPLHAKMNEHWLKWKPSIKLVQ
jgi:hypothetical protein